MKTRATILVLSLAVSCGGTAPSAKAPPVEEPGDESTASDSSSDSEEEGAAEEPASDPACADGTCFSCGDALCFQGHACDESASPNVCTWVPRCAPKGDCGCLERALPGCRCESRNEGTYLRCN